MCSNWRLTKLCDTVPEAWPGSVGGKITVLLLIATFVEGGFVTGFVKWLMEGSGPGTRIPNVLEARWGKGSWVKSSRIWTFTIFWNEFKWIRHKSSYQFKRNILFFNNNKFQTNETLMNLDFKVYSDLKEVNLLVQFPLSALDFFPSLPPTTSAWMFLGMCECTCICIWALVRKSRDNLGCWF